MKKNVFTALLMGAVSMALLSGCAFCRKPALDSCVDTSGDHSFVRTTDPGVLTMAQPVVLPSGEVLRPVFKAGAKPLTVSGIGLSQDVARINAITSFMEESKCDYIVAVSFRYEKTVHPTWKFWKFFRQTTYTATLTGMPVTLTSLLSEKAPKTAEFNTPLPPAKN